MANQDQLKSMLVSLGQLTLRVRDHLSNSHDRVTYANLLEELKQNVNDIEEMTATLSEEAEAGMAPRGGGSPSPPMLLTELVKSWLSWSILD